MSRVYDTPAQKEGMLRINSSLARLGLQKKGPWPILLSDEHKPIDDLRQAVRVVVEEAPEGSPILQGVRPKFFGELAYDGTIKPVRGLFAALLDGQEGAVIPASQAGEGQHAARITGRKVLVASTLAEVLDHLTGKALLSEATGPE